MIMTVIYHCLYLQSGSQEVEVYGTDVLCFGAVKTYPECSITPSYFNYAATGIRKIPTL